MKNNVLIVLFICFISFIHAQKLDVGFELSPQFTFALTPDTAASNKGIKMGLRYGMHLDYNISDRFAINTGVYGNLIGAKVDYAQGFVFEKSNNYAVSPGSRVNYLFNYIEIPMNLMLKTNELGHKISIYALTGFSNRFMVASKTKFIDGLTGVESDKFRTYKDMRFYDIPFNFGAGITYRIKDDFKGIVGLQYSHGLIDITKRDSNKVTISSVMLNVGVLF